MFDFGWSELLIIAVVMILVIGPKDLPRVLRGLGRAMGAVRRTANEFRAQFEDAVRESELEELRRDFQDVGSIDPAAGLQGAIDDAFEPAGEATAVPPVSKARAKSKSAGSKKAARRKAPVKRAAPRPKNGPKRATKSGRSNRPRAARKGT